MASHPIAIEIPRGTDGPPIAARLDLPTGIPAAYALYAHCFTCSKDNIAARELAMALTERSIAVLRFDFTGTGKSGEYLENFSENVRELVQVAAYMSAHNQAPSLLIGHSLGGAAVLCAAKDIPSAKAVATIGAPSRTSHLADLLQDRFTPKDDGMAHINIAGAPYNVRHDFLDDLRKSEILPCVENLGLPFLILHAPLDEVVGIDHASALFTHARHPKSFIALDGADHLLRQPEQARYAANVIAAWASRYLPQQSATMEAPGVGQVLVRETRLGNYQNHILVRNHSLTVDEPQSHKGMDTGPTPTELLSAALGACTSITLRMYADRKQWPVEGIEVRVKQQRVEGAGVRFTRLLTLEGELDDAQHQRMMEIANKCPVHKIIEEGAEIITKNVGHEREQDNG